MLPMKFYHITYSEYFWDEERVKKVIVCAYNAEDAKNAIIFKIWNIHKNISFEKCTTINATEYIIAK